MTRTDGKKNVGEVHLADILDALQLGKGRPSRAEEDPEGNTGILRLGAVDYDSKSVNWAERMRVSDYDPGEHHFLRTGDVLIVGRGAQRTVFLMDDPPPRTVADRTFFVARPDTEQVEPAFLAWYLNEKRAQHYLEAHSQGTSIQTIKKSALGRLPVQLPDRDTQCQIAELQSLVQRERELLNEWMDRRAELVRSASLRKLEVSNQ